MITFEHIFNRRDTTRCAAEGPTPFASRQDVEYCLSLCTAFDRLQKECEMLRKALRAVDAGRLAAGQWQLTVLRRAWQSVSAQARRTSKLANCDVFEFPSSASNKLIPVPTRTVIQADLIRWQRKLHLAKQKVAELKDTLERHSSKQLGQNTGFARLHRAYE